jgi:hypothetical protein
LSTKRRGWDHCTSFSFCGIHPLEVDSLGFLLTIHVWTTLVRRNLKVFKKKKNIKSATQIGMMPRNLQNKNIANRKLSMTDNIKEKDVQLELVKKTLTLSFFSEKIEG